MKIGLPDNQPDKTTNNNVKISKKTINNKQRVKSKVEPENIQWRDNGDTISAKIGGDIIHIDKMNFNIQLKNGFIIKCKDLESAKSKAILLFNN